MTSRPPKPKIISLADPIDLLDLAEGSNPFIPAASVRDRDCIDERLGLLVGGPPEELICLYLSIGRLHDLMPWMTHAAAWFHNYPRWRHLHRLGASQRPVTTVLAAPEFSESVQLALALVKVPVTLARYYGIESGSTRDLWWEGFDEAEIRPPIAPEHRPSDPFTEEAQYPTLSAEEFNFFRRSPP